MKTILNTQCEKTTLQVLVEVVDTNKVLPTFFIEGIEVNIKTIKKQMYKAILNAMLQEYCIVNNYEIQDQE